MTEREEQAQNRKDSIVRDAVNSSIDKRGRLIVILAIAAAVVCAAVGAIAAHVAYTTVQDSAQSGVTLATQVQAACADPNVDDTELGSLCANADSVVEEAPAAAKGEKGDPGDPGLPGSDGEPGPPPSDAQVANAVASYCAAGRCDGSDGRNGRDVTATQVAEAVASYCNSRGECRGPEGAGGPDGQDGAPGDRGERGETGPPPTDSQVLAAVTTFCSTRDNCQGTRGANGEPGPQGPAGPEGPAGPQGVPGDALIDGQCGFTGFGTISITINTSTGPTTFECVGSTPATPGTPEGN